MTTSIPTPNPVVDTGIFGSKNTAQYVPDYRPDLSDEVMVYFSPLESLFEVLQEAKGNSTNEVVVSLAIVCEDLVKHAEKQVLHAIACSVRNRDGILVVDYSKVREQKEVVA